jgi:hypothetical protein
MYTKEAKELVNHIKGMISLFCIKNNVMPNETLCFQDVCTWTKGDENLNKYYKEIEHKGNVVEEVLDILEDSNDITYDTKYIGNKIGSSFYINFPLQQ